MKPGSCESWCIAPLIKHVLRKFWGGVLLCVVGGSLFTRGKAGARGKCHLSYRSACLEAEALAMLFWKSVNKSSSYLMKNRVCFIILPPLATIHFLYSVRRTKKVFPKPPTFPRMKSFMNFFLWRHLVDTLIQLILITFFIWLSSWGLEVLLRSASPGMGSNSQSSDQ